MRFASFILKVIAFVLLAVLFALFVLYASFFGEDGNMADLAMSNILISVMILVMIMSAVASLLFDFYERNKWQNEKMYNSLNEKIEKLAELEPKINKITEEKSAEISGLMQDLAVRIEKNTEKFEKYMTQFANLSVQVFSKDKQQLNMEHEQNNFAEPEFKASEDYFNHYTNIQEAEPEPISQDIAVQPEEILPEPEELEDDIVDLSLDNKVEPIEETVPVEAVEPVAEITEEPAPVEFEKPAEVPLENEPVENESFNETKSIEDILSENVEKTEPEKPISVEDILKEDDFKSGDESDKLSSIFNDELANTLAGLEIMQDEKETPKLREIDLSAYYNSDGKVTL